MGMQITFTLRQIQMPSHYSDVLRKRFALWVGVASWLTLLASPIPQTAWAGSRDWTEEEKALEVTFPTRDFYIHAPPFKLRLADVEKSLRKNASGLPILMKYFDGSKAKHDTSAARTHPDPDSVYKGRWVKYLGQTTFGQRLKANNCGLAASKPDEDGFVQYQTVECDAPLGAEYFEFEGMKFKARYTKPENVPYVLFTNYCDEDSDTEDPKTPTIFIEDYLTTSEITLVEDYKLKDGTVIQNGNTLKCRPDQLNPDGIVKCSYVGWDPCDSRPFFGEAPKPKAK